LPLRIVKDIVWDISVISGLAKHLSSQHFVLVREKQDLCINRGALSWNLCAGHPCLAIVFPAQNPWSAAT
jgi:hypothetical protein